MTRAVAILRVLGRGEAPLGVQAIARELKLVPSTCLHILRALVAEELVAFDSETKRYRLDTGLLSLAHTVLKSSTFGEVVQPHLEALSRSLGATAIGLQVRGIEHVVVTAISRAREPFHIHVDVGSRFPALISATGRCVAAFGGHEQVELKTRFRQVRWDRAPSWTGWMREVKATKVAGYGIDVDSYIRGVTVVSAPVLVRGAVAHALVVVGLTERLRDRTEAIGAELKRLAGEIERRLDG